MEDMGDRLQSFRGGEKAALDERPDGHDVELLVFAHGDTTYAVPARSVDAVVAWRRPAQLPASVPGVAGVVQDRGRVVVVLDSPLGRPADRAEDDRRVVICATERGLLGLPCRQTRQVGTVSFAHVPTTGELVDSSSGPLIYLDPAVVAESLGRG